MFLSPRPETTRSRLTLPLSVRRRYCKSSNSVSSRAGKSACPPSEAIGMCILPFQTSIASPSPVPAETSPRLPTAPASPALNSSIWSAVSSGMPYPFASRSLIRNRCSILRFLASSRESSSQGRFVSLSRPPRTGPGTPKQAAVTSGLPLSVRNFCATSSRPPYSLAGNISSRKWVSCPWSKPYSARTTFVPPTSPASIMLRSPTQSSFYLQSSHALFIYRRQQRSGVLVEKQQKPAALRLNQLRWQRFRIIRTLEHAMQWVGLGVASNQKEDFRCLDNHRPGERNSPGLLLMRHVIRNRNPAQLVKRFGVGKQRGRVPIVTHSQR